MNWGTFRIVLFSVAFLFGLFMANPHPPVVLAPSTEIAAPISLSQPTIDSEATESVVIACPNGHPAVFGNNSGTRAVDVTCKDGHMRVIRLTSKAVPAQESSFREN